LRWGARRELSFCSKRDLCVGALCLAGPNAFGDRIELQHPLDLSHCAPRISLDGGEANGSPSPNRSAVLSVGAVANLLTARLAAGRQGRGADLSTQRRLVVRG
jgi:hypothetical protein